MIWRLALTTIVVALPVYGQYYNYEKCEAIARTLERKQKEWERLEPYLEKDKKGIMDYHRSQIAPRYCSKLYKREDPLFNKCRLQLTNPDLLFLPKGALDPITLGKDSFYNDPLLLRIEKKKNDGIQMITEDHYETLKEIRTDYRKAKCP
jgi:hypothetical protein